MANETEPLSRILEQSGIFHHIAGQTLEEVLLDALQRIALPPGVDARQILAAVMERESLASSAIGDGLAIPHCRHLSLAALPAPLVSLNFLSQTLAVWGESWMPVSAFFLILCPNAIIHLKVVSRLSTLLRRVEFKGLLNDKADRESILALARSLEQSLERG